MNTNARAIGGFMKPVAHLRGQDIMHVVKLGQSREVVETAQDVQTIDVCPTVLSLFARKASTHGSAKVIREIFA